MAASTEDLAGSVVLGQPEPKWHSRKNLTALPAAQKRTRELLLSNPAEPNHRKRMALSSNLVLRTKRSKFFSNTSDRISSPSCGSNQNTLYVPE